MDPAEASARVRAAAELGPSVSLTGNVMSPALSVVAATQADGVISARHAQVITDTLDLDGRLAVEAHHQRRQEPHLTTCIDGLVKFSGYLTPLVGAELRTVLDSYSPRRTAPRGKRASVFARMSVTDNRPG